MIGPIGSRLALVGSPERETYEDALRVMAEVIEPACLRHGLTAVRADSLAQAGEITDQIFRRLRDDDVVIADLTGANPNVMYELGLRHTRDKLTVQIGEFGRLPFDVNTIRTVQFSRSAIGLVNARDELREILEAGLNGDYDPVSATRIWLDAADSVLDDPSEEESGPVEPHADAQAPGTIDILAAAEEGAEALVPALHEINSHIVELGLMAERSTAQVASSDAAGKGMRGRLQVLT